MRPINWYNPEQNVFGAIARAQNRGDVVPPFDVPPWLLGVAPGTPALPMPEAGQVSFRGNVRRPSYAQTVQATFGYGDAGACNPCGQEAGAAGDVYDKIRLAYVAAADDWGWDISYINEQDWNLAATATTANNILIGFLAEYCGVPVDVTTARLAVTEYEPAEFRAAILSLVGEYCPSFLPGLAKSTVQVGADECPAGEMMTEVPVFVNGRQVGTSTVCAPLDRIVVPPGDETELNGTGEKKKGGYPIWGYYVAGGVGLLALGGVAYYATRKA